jgi:hypothetical protein
MRFNRETQMSIMDIIKDALLFQLSIWFPIILLIVVGLVCAGVWLGLYSLMNWFGP